MAASRIPNLNTLRTGGLRDRNGSRIPKSNDEIIQATDHDAAMSRVSAVESGYMDDPFAKLLTTEYVQRRLPLMNRGTYVRTTGIDKVVDTFLSSHSGPKQIYSLGAGSDTRYFRLKRRYQDLGVVYHEIDFAANTRTKISRLQTASTAIEKLSGVRVANMNASEENLDSSHYHIHAQDLRTVDLSMEDIPTLVISECCLIYLSPEDADAVLDKFIKPFTTVAVVIYEPINPNDAFGRTMVRNLTARGIHLQTLEKYASLEDQKQRLNQRGLEGRAASVDYIWRTWIEEKEKERIDKLEWMDEVEEFILLAKHYCIAWGWKGFVQNSEWQGLKAT